MTETQIRCHYCNTNKKDPNKRNVDFFCGLSRCKGHERLCGQAGDEDRCESGNDEVKAVSGGGKTGSSSSSSGQGFRTTDAISVREEGCGAPAQEEAFTPAVEVPTPDAAA